MENSDNSAAKWSDSNSQYMVSSQTDSDWSRFNLAFSSSSSATFAPDEFVGGIIGKSGSHRLAEKRRRDRINSHLSALRKLVPDSDKLDKAALLGKVMEQVTDLKYKAKDSPFFQDLPTETDEVTVLHHESIDSDTNRVIAMFKASVCCEDQPEAITEIVKALTKLKLEILQAEIIYVGGRTRMILVLKESNCKETIKSLKQSLCSALNRITSSSSSSSVCRIRSKRQRWFLSSHYSQ